MLLYHSFEENQFVSNLIPGEQFWIGYTDELQEGEFSWVDNMENNFTNWAPTEPSNSGPTGNEDYALINTSEGGSSPFEGFWNDADDNIFEWPYVLEISTQAGCVSTDEISVIFDICGNNWYHHLMKNILIVLFVRNYQIILCNTPSANNRSYLFFQNYQKLN